MAFHPDGSNPGAEEPPGPRHVKALCRELVTLLQRRTGTDGGHDTAIPQLKLYRFSGPTEPTQLLQQPAVYVVVQGRKKVMVGDGRPRYAPFASSRSRRRSGPARPPA